jgi:hypothetical protein
MYDGNPQVHYVQIPTVMVLTLIKKKIQFSIICKKIQNGAVAKSYTRKGFLI